MAITRYSFKPVQARSQQKETLILDKELNLYRTLKKHHPLLLCSKYAGDYSAARMKKIAKQISILITE